MEGILPGRGILAELVPKPPPEMEVETGHCLEVVTPGPLGPLTGTRPTLPAAISPSKGLRASPRVEPLSIRRGPQRLGKAGQPPEAALVIPAEQTLDSCARTTLRWCLE